MALNFSTLDQLIRTDPRDAGCGATVELLHVYAELAAADPVEAARRHPGIAAHLGCCGPCTVDFEGLLALLR